MATVSATMLARSKTSAEGVDDGLEFMGGFYPSRAFLGMSGRGFLRRPGRIDGFHPGHQLMDLLVAVGNTLLLGGTLGGEVLVGALDGLVDQPAGLFHVAGAGVKAQPVGEDLH